MLTELTAAETLGVRHSPFLSPRSFMGPSCPRHFPLLTHLPPRQKPAEFAQSSAHQCDRIHRLLSSRISSQILPKHLCFSASTHVAVGVCSYGAPWSRGSSVWTRGRTSLWGWQSTGTGCPGRLWSLLLWRYSRPTWTRSCAACSGWPCFVRGLDWVTHRGPFQPLTFCDSVILWCRGRKRELVGTVPAGETLWVETQQCRTSSSLPLLIDAPSDTQRSGPASCLCPAAGAGGYQQLSSANEAGHGWPERPMPRGVWICFSRSAHPPWAVLCHLLAALRQVTLFKTSATETFHLRVRKWKLTWAWLRSRAGGNEYRSRVMAQHLCS